MEFRSIQTSVGSQQCKIAYTQFGDQKNHLVICLHGINRNSRDFDFLASTLQDKYFVICPDIVGRGDSTWLEDKTKYKYPVYIKIINSLVNQLNKEEFSIIGTSMGGVLGMHIASKDENNVKKLVINDIGPDLSSRSLTKLIKGLQTKKMKNESDMLKYMKTYLSPIGIQDEKVKLHFAYHSVKKKENGSYEMHYDPEITVPLYNASEKDFYMYSMWEKIKCPILLLRGEYSNTLRRSVANKMIESKKYIKFIEYKGVAHAPSLAEVHQMNDILNWLQNN